jgi:hypothetical protein
MPLNIISYSDIRDLSVRDPAGRIWVSAGPCQTVSYDTWVSRPGRYLLPSGFTSIRITELLLTHFPVLLLQTPEFLDLGNVLGSKAKKIRIRVPTLSLFQL